MSREEVRQLFSRSPGLAWLSVTGGEALLRDDLPELLDTALSANPRLALLQLATNGSLPERAEAAAKRVLARRSPPRLLVTVSVDGPRELHDRLRGVTGAFDGAVETLRRLRAVPGCRAAVSMTLSAGNRGRGAETAAALGSLIPGLVPGDIHLNILHRSRHYYGHPGKAGVDTETAPEDLAQGRAALGLALGPSAWVERAFLAIGQRRLGPEQRRPPLSCVALSATCFVAPDGAVYPCIGWDRPVARLADHGFELGRAWNSPQAARARGEIGRGECPGCWTACEAVPALLARPESLLEGLR